MEFNSDKSHNKNNIIEQFNTLFYTNFDDVLDENTLHINSLDSIITYQSEPVCEAQYCLENSFLDIEDLDKQLRKLCLFDKSVSDLCIKRYECIAYKNDERYDECIMNNNSLFNLPSYKTNNDKIIQKKSSIIKKFKKYLLNMSKQF